MSIFHTIIATLSTLSFVMFCGCTGDSVETDVFGGNAAYDIVASGTQCSAFLVDLPTPDDSGQPAMLGDYRITEGPVNVDEDLRSQLATVITQHNTYVWDTDKGCIPKPGVRIQFSKAGDDVDILFCFECSMLYVYQGGVLAGTEHDFDGGRPTIVRIMKKIFPDSATIQGLSENE